jgi:dipeptidyl aminopeptidase/acylaminoacyl peptidase
MRRLGWLLIASLICIGASAARSQPAADSSKYQDVFYASGNLRIQAYLYKPEGDGPFPAVIYNHGTRDGRERASFPFPHVGKMLTRAGYAVLVPERRGYGKSDGGIWWQEVGSDQSRVIPRLQAETDDVLAGIDYLRTLPYVDAKRLAVMGWSFGALVAAAEKSATPTLFMVAKNDRTTLSVTTLAEIFRKRNVAHKLAIYDPFTPS